MPTGNRRWRPEGRPYRLASPPAYHLQCESRYSSPMNPRTWLAAGAGRAAGAASRALRRGGGTAVAGLVAQQIDPRLAARLAEQLGGGCAVITGTNGKTTTARMLAATAREAVPQT